MELKKRIHRIHSQEDHWIPLSDLMTGLMMIFMLVAIIFMIQLKHDEAKIIAVQSRVKDIALQYTDLRAQLYRDLEAEFKNDFKKWQASIKPDLTIRFQEPSVQFNTGSAVVKDSFKSILSSFFPRYIRILRSPKYRDAIDEVRIEGHTSSIWKGLPPEQAYYQNMQLSQERTRAVLMYVFSLSSIRDDQTLKWLLNRVTANGLSSAHMLYLPNGAEDIVGSQRVEFKVRTSAEKRLEKILKALSQ
jgi:outer membrane protein OmpA-like peptidoglycan-associated protein